MACQKSNATNGYRAIRTSFLPAIMNHLKNYNGYVFQIALLDKAVKHHVKIAEVPIQFKERASGKSKISAFRYIYDILTYIFFHSSFVKFGIVGFIGFAINLAGLEIFYRFGFTPAIAAAIGAEISIVSNFLFNNFWSFSHKKIPHKTHYLPKFVHFNALSLGSIVIQFIVVGLGTSIFGNHTRILFLLISVVFFIMPYSYFMYNRFIWKGK
jgi:dolichol-phosphate mannosyltransferase